MIVFYVKIRCIPIFLNIFFSVFSVLDDKREDTITKINSKLPPCIKIQAIRKVTKNFNCKSACDSRTYLYLIPTFAFAPVLPINELKSPEEEVSPEMYQVRLFSRNFFSLSRKLINIFFLKFKVISISYFICIFFQGDLCL